MQLGRWMYWKMDEKTNKWIVNSNQQTLTIHFLFYGEKQFIESLNIPHSSRPQILIVFKIFLETK